MEWYAQAWKKYADFGGRARRREYWTFVLVNFAAFYALLFGEVLIGGVGIAGLLFSLAALVPGLAVFWRRLHDTGRSGLWFLLNFVPLVGQIVLLIVLTQDSQRGTNRYGDNPKGALA